VFDGSVHLSIQVRIARCRAREHHT
jgi:hypothetical protein